MGVELRIVGFRPPDERWQQMKAAWDAMKAANLDPPAELWEFFGDEPPRDEGVEVDISAAVTEWSEDYAAGYTVDVRRLPPEVYVVRCYESI